MKILEVDRYRVTEAVFEGVRIVLDFLGERHTPAYVQGLSGAAFRIAGICPCAPTVSVARQPADLLRHLGYEVEERDLFGDPGAKIAGMVEAVRREIDRGRPALVWNAFTTAEWDVVCGYDEEREVFLGRGSYMGMDDLASAPWARAVEFDPAIGAVLVGRKVSEPDARALEREALTEAVRHGRDVREPSQDGSWVMYQGIQCYRRWADEFAAPGKERGLGDAYCHGIYASTHRAAADFLREIADRHGRASARLREAADHFERESGLLQGAGGLLGWASSGGVDEERSGKVAPVLKECADAYERAIGCLEQALPLL
jgi:hypothetical protein